MKKPEEIKKGLGDLNQKLLQGFVDRPPITPEEAAELVRIAESVANYQQVSKALCNKENATLDEVLQAASQVKAELADAKLNHQHTIDIAERQKEQINKLKKLVVKINRERRELEEIFRIYPAVCVVCKNYEEGSCKSEPNKYGTCFEWRGACPENTEETRKE